MLKRFICLGEESADGFVGLGWIGVDGGSEGVDWGSGNG